MEGQARDSTKDMTRETDRFVAGPGMAATKTQTRGSAGGAIIGAVVGALIGWLIGSIAFASGRMVVISVIAFAVAGATSAGVIGGFVRPRQKLEEGEADT